MKALGCFNDSISDRLFPDTLENEGHSGSKIDWQNYRHSMEEYAHCDIPLLDYTNLYLPGFDHLAKNWQREFTRSYSDSVTKSQLTKRLTLRIVKM